ncbi:MAG: hypothetical protein M3N47_09390 [Chloroflexota bacterium]|nr:hypothetical protein [Chloroflexota bacterium]
MRIASYNVENPFERARALSADDPAAAGDPATEAIAAQGEINTLLRKATYNAQDRRRILELLEALGLDRRDDGGQFALLRQNRGQLMRRRQNGIVESLPIVALTALDGSSSRPSPSTRRRRAIPRASSSRVDADVVGVVEAETRGSLRDFGRVMLRRVGGEPYAHSMLIQGNDDRGINVGVMTKDVFQIESDAAVTRRLKKHDGLRMSAGVEPPAHWCQARLTACVPDAARVVVRAATCALFGSCHRLVVAPA